jgi:hypothetical protein
LKHPRIARTGRSRERRILRGIALLLLWETAGAGAQENPGIPQYEIKAAYLYNFAKFIEWPASTFKDKESPFRIGILGEDPFREVLDRLLKGKRVNGRSFEVIRSERLEPLLTCHTLFVSDSEKGRMRQILTSLRELPILTVGDTSGFASAGGSVNFFIRDGTVRIEINTAAAARARLKISAKLLQIARLVEEEQP